MLWLMIFWGLQPAAGSAAEIAPFRLTDYSAFMQSETLFRDVQTESVSGVISETQFRSLREAGVTTQSYLYHPNLLQMDISGSIFQQSASLTDDNTETDSSDFSWNFGAFFRVLQKKPYPLTLFFTRSNPLVATGLAETFIQKNSNYGFNLGLQQPFTPVNMSINAERATTQGEGANQVINDTNDRIRFQATHQFYRDSLVNFTYYLNHRLSASGSTNLPIREFEWTEHRTNLDSRWLFGEQKQYLFRERISINSRDNPEVIDFHFSPLLDWRHSPRMDSFYRYNFSMIDRPGDSFDNQEHDASARLQYKPTNDLYGDIEVLGGHAEQGSGALQQRSGIRTSANYKRPVPYGVMGLGGAVSYSLNRREASVGQIQILDEAHTLSGTTPVALNREFIFILTVVVTNTTQTQTFIEGTDYQLTVVGAQTFVDRLIGSPNMTDPQDVLVDYAFDPGGTFDFSSLGLSVNANLVLARYYSLFARYNEIDLTVTSGLPTIQLNSTRSIEVGASANVPLRWWGLQVGGEARYRRQFEEINSSDNTNFIAYLSLPLPYRSTLRVSARRTLTVNESSPWGTDLIGFSANLNSRPWTALLLTAGVNYEEDTGSLFKTTRADATLVATWQYRKLHISANAVYGQQTQGDISRDSLSAILNVRRDIW